MHLAMLLVSMSLSSTAVSRLTVLTSITVNAVSRKNSVALIR
jgi:hypothetical protein